MNVASGEVVAFRGKDGDSYCRKEIKWFHEATEKAFGTKMLLAGN